MSSRFVRGTHTQIWGWSFVLLSTLFLSPVAAAAVHRALADSAIVLPLPEGALPRERGERYILASAQDADGDFDVTTDMVVAILVPRRVVIPTTFTSFASVPMPSNYCLPVGKSLRRNAPPRAPPV
jgi:hypothetical protein